MKVVHKVTPKVMMNIYNNLFNNEWGESTLELMVDFYFNIRSLRKKYSIRLGNNIEKLYNKISYEELKILYLELLKIEKSTIK